MASKHEVQIRCLVATLTNMIAKSLPEVLTDELRDFINYHKDIPEFKELAFTMILLSMDETRV